MMYHSTRDKSVRVSAAQAIAQGISKEGGLFVPVELPLFDMMKLMRYESMGYASRAQDILAAFLTDFSADELRECVHSAYGTHRFDHERIAPIFPLGDTMRLLELWHGPTCAFKDMALQLLPHLLTRAVKKTMGGKHTAILVATSGDTGKAALDGFADVPDTSILVFYPHGGVSEVQRLQMATQKGNNTTVVAVRGNFDDTQTAVKKIFTNHDMNKMLADKGMVFSSANSINWGRLVPQIVYYISAYCDMAGAGDIQMGEKINICVPTGNFGNILAAYYAKHMGLPVNMLICASNVNKVLSDFIETGVYDRRREFVLTSSPSMDILISSNLERLLFALCGEDDKMVADMMGSLTQTGVYTIPDAAREKLQSEFAGGFCDEQKTGETIRGIFELHGYLCDTHTAVAVDVHRQYMERTGDKTKTLIASTANPYKFAAGILPVFERAAPGASEFAQIRRLREISGMEVPEQLLELEGKDIRFDTVCGADEMESAVRQALKK
ncbi:MAG: threonine synthase [Oscillospiraceae bacterium]|nr:threonine synthase [Oscillospiraceae bacterium]